MTLFAHVAERDEDGALFNARQTQSGATEFELRRGLGLALSSDGTRVATLDMQRPE